MLLHHRLFKVNKQHCVAAWFLLLFYNLKLHIADLVLTRNEKWVLYDTESLPDIGYHNGNTRPPLNVSKIMLTIWLTSLQAVHYEVLLTG